MNNRKSLTRLAVAALLVALGVLLSPLSVPVGAAKIFPVQHALNVMAAVILGCRYGTAAAFCVSTLRNILGMGTVLAYPGSMCGAFLSAFMYKRTGSVYAAAIGEVVGTGILGGLISWPVGSYILGSAGATWFFFIVAFLPSTVIGSIVGTLVCKVLLLERLKEYLYK